LKADILDLVGAARGTEVNWYYFSTQGR
jgi:hypothetical protein